MYIYIRNTITDEMVKRDVCPQPSRQIAHVEESLVQYQASLVLQPKPSGFCSASVRCLKLPNQRLSLSLSLSIYIYYIFRPARGGP